MKIAVIYYSRSGSTRQLADDIASKTGADIEEINCTVNMKGLIGFLRAGRESMAGKPAPIAPLKTPLENYDLIVLGSPVWAGKLSAPALAFIDNSKGRVKQLAAFILHADAKNEYGSVFDQIELASGLKLRATFSGVTKEIQNGHADLSAFLDHIKE